MPAYYYYHYYYTTHSLLRTERFVFNAPRPVFNPSTEKKRICAKPVAWRPR